MDDLGKHDRCVRTTPMMLGELTVHVYKCCSDLFDLCMCFVIVFNVVCVLWLCVDKIVQWR